MKLFYIISSFISICFASEYVIINCSWPCPNPTHGCILTSTEAHCGERTLNNWMINSPQKAPYYTGATISVHLQPCHPVPIPNLPNVELNNKTEIGQSIILWPIENIRRPQDTYLGNCGHGFYCSSAGSDELFPICRQRFDIESHCVSSNQCTTNFCNNNTCQINTHQENRPSHTRWDNNKQQKDKTAQILASVFGIVGGLVMIAIAFIVYAKKKKKQVPNQNSSCLPLHEQFASDFQHEISQSQLQEHYTKPPPSYTP